MELDETGDRELREVDDPEEDDPHPVPPEPVEELAPDPLDGVRMQVHFEVRENIRRLSDATAMARAATGELERGSISLIVVADRVIWAYWATPETFEMRPLTVHRVPNFIQTIVPFRTPIETVPGCRFIIQKALTFYYVSLSLRLIMYKA